MDPYEFRRESAEQAAALAAVLDAAAKKAQWGRPAAGRYQGIALMSGYDTYLAQVAEVSVQGGKLKVHRIVCAIDCGQMVNPDIVQAQAEGSIVFGLTAALWGEINIASGQVQEQNFDTATGSCASTRRRRSRCICLRALRSPAAWASRRWRSWRRRCVTRSTRRRRNGSVRCRSRSRGIRSESDEPDW